MATNEADKWFEQYIMDRWERLRRHPDYRTFCRKYRKYFDDGMLNVGIVYDYDAQNPSEALKALEAENALDEHYALEAQEALEAQNALEVIKKQFDLDTVYHYDLDFTAAEMWASPPIFNNSLAVTPQWDRTELDDETTEFSLVRDEHYIDCRINISPDISLQSIKAEIAGIVNYARSETAEKENRLQADSNVIAYKVYDMRLARIPFCNISRELGISKEAARHKFRKAWELINHEKYNPKKIISLIQQKLAEQRKWAEIKKTEPAPKEMLAFADDDGGIPLIDNYPDENESWIKRESERCEDILYLYAHCKKCNDDTACSSEMTTAFNHWIDTGEADFSKTTPCPTLREMIIKK